MTEICGDSRFIFNEDGVWHCETGPAIFGKGYEAWYINGQLHRLDGPSIINNDGSTMWYKDNKLHCESGPAASWPRQNLYEYYLEGIQYSPEEFNLKMLEKKLDILGLD